MTVKTNAVTVTTTATALSTVPTDATSGQSVCPYNDSATVFYVGGSDVTASGAKKGVPVAANSYGPGFQLDGGESLYGITASGTASCIVLETGV